MERTPLYERLARELESQILAGTFPEGSRLPSLRESSASRALSLSTVLEAYRLLEARGLVEMRPQSGCYVRFRQRGTALEAEPEALRGDPTTVSIDELSLELFRDRRDPDFAQFGAAAPDPELLPTARLNRILAELAREGSFSVDTSVEPEGREELRVQIARRAFAAGSALRPDEIVITAGCSEALALSLQALCPPGSLVALESPGYFGSLLQLEALGLKALEIPAHPGSGLSLDALEFALDHHPVRALLAMTNFSNPLGSLMPEADKERLVALLSDRGIPLIENDIYGELYFGESRPRPAKSYDRRGEVLLCSSFSKDLSPGYRIGWVAAGARFKEVMKLKMALNSGTSVLPQLTIARYLESGGYDLHLRKIRRAYAEKVARMSAAIAAGFPAGTRISEPLGGYLLWVRLPEELDAMLLYREAVKSRITLAPGPLFSASGKYRNYVRLNAAVWSERTEKDLARLGRLAEALLGSATKL